MTPLKKWIFIIILLTFFPTDGESKAWNQVEPSLTTNYLYGIWGTSYTNVVAVGEGIIIHFDGDAWQVVDIPPILLYSIWGNSEIGLYAVGYDGSYSGRILHYDGTNWTEIETPFSGTFSPLFDIWGTSENHLFVSGAKSTSNSQSPEGGYEEMVYYYDGSNWTEIQVTSDCQNCLVTSVGGNTTHNLCIIQTNVMGTSNLLHYNGTSWAQKTNLSMDEYEILYDIWVESDNNIFVAIGSTIFQNDGENTVQMPITQEFKVHQYSAIWGRSTTDIFAGGKGIVLHYDGTKWEDMSIPEDLSETMIAGIWGTDDYVFGVGEQGLILIYKPPVMLSVQNTATEADGLLPEKGLVYVTTASSEPINISLSSSDPSELTVPSTVIIPAGLTSATFDIRIIDDDKIDGTQDVTIFANTNKFSEGKAIVSIHDNESAILTLTAIDHATEGDGVIANACMLSVNTVAEKNIKVYLHSSDTTEISVSDDVIIPVGSDHTAFSITVIDDVEFDYTQTVTISATIEGWVSGTDTLIIEDNETKELFVSLPENVSEGDDPFVNSGTISIPGTYPQDIEITLFSSNTNQLIVPETVTLFSGLTMVSFDLQIIDNDIINDIQEVSITATSMNWISGVDSILIQDDDPCTIQFKSEVYRAKSDWSGITIDVVLTSNHSEVLTIDYYAYDISAIAGKDYTLTPGRLVFQKNELYKSFYVEINHHIHRAIDQLIGLTILNPDGLVELGAKNHATLYLSGTKNWQWLMPQPTGNNLFSVWGSSYTNIYCVGSKGTMIHFNGNEWSSIDIGVDNDLYSIWGVSENNIYAVGKEGLIIHYNGITWTSMSNPSYLDLYDIWGTSENNIYAVGGYSGYAQTQGIILHFNGHKWSIMHDGCPLLKSIYGNSENCIFAVGWQTTDSNDSLGFILKYNGEQWTTLHKVPSIEFSSIWTDRENLFVTGNKGKILHQKIENNTMLNWSIDSFGENFSFTSIWGFSGSNVIAAGSYYGRVLIYNGNDWSTKNFDDYNTILDIWGKDEFSILVGIIGTIVKYESDTLSSMYETNSYYIEHICPVTDDGIIFSAQQGFGANAIFHYTNNNWIDLEYPSHKINSMWGDSKNNVFIFSNEGAIFHYDGENWHEMTTPLTGTDEDIEAGFGFSENDVFAVSDQFSILHYDGNTWSQMDHPLEHTVAYNFSMWGSSGSNVYIIGANIVIKYDGLNWEKIDHLSDTDLIWGFSENNIFTVKYDQISHYNGIEWKQKVLPEYMSGLNFYDIWGGSDHDLFISAYEGRLFYYNGQAWREMTTGTSETIQHIRGTYSGFDVYGVCSNGAVLHYTRDLMIKVPEIIMEGNVQTGVIELRAPPSQDMLIALSSDNPSLISIPQSVSILAGQKNTAFTITVLDDTIFNSLFQTINVTASIADITINNTQFQIQDDDTGELSLTIPDSAVEGDGILHNQGIITLSKPLSTDLTISLFSENNELVLVPKQVTISHSYTQAVFDLTISDDNIYFETNHVSISASSIGWVSSTDSIEIIDNDQKTITIVLPEKAYKTDGCLSNQALVSVNTTPQADLIINLVSSDINAINVSETVTIPVGSISTPFDITILNDGLIKGIQYVAIIGTAPDYIKGNDTILIIESGFNTGLSGDDRTVNNIPIGFPFQYFGHDCENFGVSTNGLINLLNDASTNYNNVDFPVVSGELDGMIALFFDDMKVQDNGKINYLTIGNEPNRQLVIQYQNMTLLSGSTNMTFEAIFFEKTNQIKFQYRFLEGINALGKCATIGIDDPSSDAYIRYSYNMDSLTPRQAILFTPDGYDGYIMDENATYSWIDISGEIDGIVCDSGQSASTQIAFSWLPITNANNYKIEIATSPDESDVIDVIEIGNECFFSYTNNLIDNTSYYARVSASFDNGASYDNPSNFSDGILIDRSPPKFENPISIPGPGKHDISFQFIATDNSRIDEYHIQISIDDPDFTTPVVDISITDVTYTYSGTPGQTVYARVYAIDCLFNQSDYTVLTDGYEIPDQFILSVNSPSSVNENSGFLHEAGIIRTNGPVFQDLVVNLSVSAPEAISIPEMVIIPKGQNFIHFDIQVIDNEDLDDISFVEITVSAQDWTSGTSQLKIIDNEAYFLILEIPDQVLENDNVLHQAGTVKLPQSYTNDILISLSSSLTSSVIVPQTITIAAGLTSSTFDITIIDNLNCSDSQFITITASAIDWISRIAHLNVKNNDGVCIGGLIDESTVWTLSESPYIVMQDIYVYGSYNKDTAPILTIEPGVVIKFETGTGLYIGAYNYYGGILAIGSESNMITFTANSVDPSPGVWKGIFFENRSYDSMTTLKYCTIEYAGNSNTPSISCSDSNPVIENCMIRNNADGGINVDQYSFPIINANTFNHNGDYAISTFAVSANDCADNSGSGNSNNCIIIRGGTINDFCRWKKNNSLYYVITSNVMIRSSYYQSKPAILSIDPGVEIRFNSNTRIYAGTNTSDDHPGILVAQGTEDNPIIFTSNERDTNNNDSYQLLFYNSHFNLTSIIEHCLIEYGGDNSQTVYIYNSSIQFNYNTIRNNNNMGLYIYGNGSNTIELNCNTFYDNETAIYASGVNLTVTNNNFINNRDYGINCYSYHIQADHNWWGIDTGPGETDNKISENVMATPFLVSENNCSFTLVTNLAPFVPENPIPKNNSVNVELTEGKVLVQWTGIDPNTWDYLVYDLYIGHSVESLTKAVSNITTPYYEINDLEDGKRYYWQILAKDSRNAESISQVWQFVVKGDAPDLTVTQVLVQPDSNIAAGDIIYFTATIQNIGNGPLVDSSQAKLVIDVDIKQSIACDQVLLSGESMTIYFSIYAQVGQYEYRIVADYYNDIVESNEENNALTFNVDEILDKTPPVLLRTVPANGDIISDFHSFKIYLSDLYGGVIDETAVSQSITLSDGNQFLLGAVSIYNYFSYYFEFTPEIYPCPDNTYYVSFDSIDMAGNSQPYTFYFIIDTTPPEKPLITGEEIYTGLIKPRPFQNISNTNYVTLSGKTNELVNIYIDNMAVASANGDWSRRLFRYDGHYTFSIKLQDLANNYSDSEFIDITIDTVAPDMIAITPANNSFMKTGPDAITIIYLEETTALNPESTSITLSNRQDNPLIGNWAIIGNNQIVYTPTTRLTDDAYTVIVQLTDNAGNGKLIDPIHFTIDSMPPQIPDINPISLYTHNPHQIITGNKDSWSGIILNGVQIIETTSEIEWSYAIDLNFGLNHLVFAAIDQSGNRSENIVIEIEYDDAPPPSIDTLVVNEKLDGKSLVLDWRQFEEYGDIDYYKIFIEASDFSQITGLTHIDSVNAGILSYTATNLNRDTNYYIVVIPVDSVGAIPTSFTTVSATPIDIIPPENISNPKVMCFQNELQLHWDHSLNTDGDLAGYKLYYNTNSEGILIPADSNSYMITGLNEATAYPCTIVAFDYNSNESQGVVINGTTLLPNPSDISMVPGKTYIDISWSHVNPVELIKHYAIYIENEIFTSIENLTPKQLVTNETSIRLSGLEKNQIYYIGVSTVNISDGEAMGITPFQAILKTTIENIYSNYGSQCKAVSDFQLRIIFNASMDTSTDPVIEMVSTGTIQPVVSAGGDWTTTRFSNDTYISPDITLSSGMDGQISVTVHSAKDLGGFEIVPAIHVYSFYLDTTYPHMPSLTVIPGIDSTAGISWQSYSPTQDLSEFKVFVETNPYTNIAGLLPVAVLDKASRYYDMGIIETSTIYYISVIPIDALGNMALITDPIEINISGTLSFDKPFYTLSDEPVIRLTASVLNTDPNTIEYISASLVSDSDLTGITLTLAEIDLNSDIFTTSGLDVKPGFTLGQSNDLTKQLSVAQSDHITVSIQNYSAFQIRKNQSIMDMEPPESSLQIQGESYFEDEILVASINTSYSLSVVDAISGIENISYRIDGQPLIDYVCCIHLNSEGYHTLNWNVSDKAGNSDNTNSQIIIVDTIPPDAPSDLTGRIEKQINQVYLEWTLNSEPDFLGYNIYKNGIKINQQIVTQSHYQDTADLLKKSVYNIAALDRIKNEGCFSNSYTISLPGAAPIITEPCDGIYLSNQTLTIRGIADAGAVVEIFMNYSSYGFADCNNQGLFSMKDVSLNNGSNFITAISKTSYGIISPTSNDIVVYFYPRPSPPINLTAQELDTMVLLSWTPVSLSDNSGYWVYRNGYRLNEMIINYPEYLDKFLTNNKTYQYTITGTNEIGIESVHSQAILATPSGNWSKSK